MNKFIILQKKLSFLSLNGIWSNRWDPTFSSCLLPPLIINYLPWHLCVLYLKWVVSWAPCPNGPSVGRITERKALFPSGHRTGTGPWHCCHLPWADLDFRTNHENLCMHSSGEMDWTPSPLITPSCMCAIFPKYECFVYINSFNLYNNPVYYPYFYRCRDKALDQLGT